jgi:hypothetical protein
MTAWTSEPPREGAWHWWRYADRNDAPTMLLCVDVEQSWDRADELRSTHPIPSAEALAAMHEVCDLVAKWRELRASQRQAGAKAEALTREVNAHMRLQYFDGAKKAAESQRAAADESARLTTAYQAMQAGDVFDAALRALEEARRA